MPQVMRQKISSKKYSKRLNRSLPEKPVMNGTMLDLATQEEYICDLIWKQAKIIFLTAENEDVASIIQDSGWTCFCSTTPGLTAEDIIRTIPEV